MNGNDEIIIEIGPTHDALVQACVAGDLATFRQLITRVEPSFESQTLLRLACWHGQLEILEELLPLPSIDINSSNILAIAANGGNTEIVKRLLVIPHLDFYKYLAKSVVLSTVRSYTVLLKSSLVEFLEGDMSNYLSRWFTQSFRNLDVNPLTYIDIKDLLCAEARSRLVFDFYEANNNSTGFLMTNKDKELFEKFVLDKIMYESEGSNICIKYITTLRSTIQETILLSLYNEKTNIPFLSAVLAACHKIPLDTVGHILSFNEKPYSLKAQELQLQTAEEALNREREEALNRKRIENRSFKIMKDQILGKYNFATAWMYPMIAKQKNYKSTDLILHPKFQKNEAIRGLKKKSF